MYRSVKSPAHRYVARDSATNSPPMLKETLEGIDMVFAFSENWPANYIFSLFSKLPTNYPKIQKIFKKQSKIRGDPRIFGKNRLFFEYFLIFWVICW